MPSDACEALVSWCPNPQPAELLSNLSRTFVHQSSRNDARADRQRLLAFGTKPHPKGV